MMPSLESISFNNALIAAILGALITILFSFTQEKRRIKKEKIDILHSLKAELIAIKALINVRRNDIITSIKLNSPEHIESYSFVYIPITYNYFTVYDSLSSKLGILDDKTLVTRIICSYADIKGLWENVKDFEYIAKKGFEISTSEENSQLLQKAVQTHYNYICAIIFQQLPIVEKTINDCIEHIDKELLTLK